MFCWKMYNLNVLVKLKNRLKHEVAMNKKKGPYSLYDRLFFLWMGALCIAHFLGFL